jgi:hypothetical protein
MIICVVQNKRFSNVDAVAPCPAQKVGVGGGGSGHTFFSLPEAEFLDVIGTKVL